MMVQLLTRSGLTFHFLFWFLFFVFVVIHQLLTDWVKWSKWSWIDYFSCSSLSFLIPNKLNECQDRYWTDWVLFWWRRPWDSNSTSVKLKKKFKVNSFLFPNGQDMQPATTWTMNPTDSSSHNMVFPLTPIFSEWNIVWFRKPCKKEQPQPEQQILFFYFFFFSSFTFPRWRRYYYYCFLPFLLQMLPTSLGRGTHDWLFLLL